MKGYRLVTSEETAELEQYREQLQASYDNLVAFIVQQQNETYRTRASRDTLKIELTGLYASMRNQLNRCSIVLHDKPQDGISNVLMTGDITVAELNKLLRGKISPASPVISKKYRVIKAPHHATKTHFTPELPECEVIMASNGETRHVKWHKISYQYGSFYHSHKCCKMICTNRRCELVDLRKVAHCANCVKPKEFVKQYNF